MNWTIAKLKISYINLCFNVSDIYNCMRRLVKSMSDAWPLDNLGSSIC
jgi:hypothetical protein